MTKEEVARQFPEAVAFARELRAVFGDGVRIMGAIDYKTGAAIGTYSGRAKNAATDGGAALLVAPSTNRIDG